jgi:exodeoxyribonuclease VII large subunit
MYATPRPAGPARALSVSELTRQIKNLLEGQLRNVWVEGEVSALTTHTSGHVYLSLKDAEARIDCVVWRTSVRMLRVRPRVGQKVLALGRLAVYAPRGTYQLVIERMEDAGAGAMEAALRELKARLEAEGLFAPERKRRLPFLPRKVGVVTSPTGAARRDVEAVLHRRAPQVPIVLYPAQVQGDGAAQDVARGIRALCRVPGVDVIIVGRGGGSAEDLSTFNEEVVARTIAACPVPIISAVGHETDTTLADLVADRRAPTPSAAAEAAVPVRDDLLQGLDVLQQRLDRAVAARLDRRRQWMDHVIQRLAAGLRFDDRHLQLRTLDARMHRVVTRDIVSAKHRVANLRTRLGEQHPRARIARARHALEKCRGQLADLGPRQVTAARAELRVLAGRLQALSPLASLERGFSITRTPEGRVVRAAAEVAVGDAVEVLLHRGRLVGRVTEVHSPEEEER